MRRSVLIDSNADILLYGNSERALVEVAHEIANGKEVKELWQMRGAAVVLKDLPEGWTEIDSTRIDWPSKIESIPNPYDFHDREPDADAATKAEKETIDAPDTAQAIKIIPMPLQRKEKYDAKTTYIRLPSFSKVVNDPALYAHASRVLHQEANPYNAKTLVQRHDTLEVWVNPRLFLSKQKKWTGYLASTTSAALTLRMATHEFPPMT